MRDFDRPLEPIGRADADTTGAAMYNNGLIPDLVLCSTARRARETLDGVTRHLGERRILFSDQLYSTDAAGYLDIIRTAEPATSILVVGHNPMMEDLAFALAGDGDDQAKAAIQSGFPTSGLAILRFDGALADAAPGKAYLETFLSPSDS